VENSSQEKRPRHKQNNQNKHSYIIRRPIRPQESQHRLRNEIIRVKSRSNDTTIDKKKNKRTKLRTNHIRNISRRSQSNHNTKNHRKPIHQPHLIRTRQNLPKQSRKNRRRQHQITKLHNNIRRSRINVPRKRIKNTPNKKIIGKHTNNNRHRKQTHKTKAKNDCRSIHESPNPAPVYIAFSFSSGRGRGAD